MKVAASSITNGFSASSTRHLARAMLVSAVLLVIYCCLLLVNTQLQESHFDRVVEIHEEAFLTNRRTSVADSKAATLPPDIAKLQPYLNRGANFLLATSGCYIASWVWVTGPRRFSDCKDEKNPELKLEGYEDQVQENDTIYVPTRLLDMFVQDGLPKITSPFVLITGAYHKTSQDYIPGWAMERLLQNQLVVKWFCQNIETHISRKYLKSNKDMAKKLAPFPFGLQAFKYKVGDPDPLPIFREAFMKHLQLPDKTKDIFAGYINHHTNPQRANIPSGPRLSLEDYYDEIAASRFVLSPNGDRPECYRHYEAIAFGAFPITELDPRIYWHLKDAPIIYSNTNWHITGPEASQRLNAQEVDRTMIFEEYWMEYVERTVNRPLRWWDRQGDKKALLKGFYMYDATTFPTPGLEQQVQEMQAQLADTTTIIRAQNKQLAALDSKLEQSNKAIFQLTKFLQDLVPHMVKDSAGNGTEGINLVWPEDTEREATSPPEKRDPPAQLPTIHQTKPKTTSLRTLRRHDDSEGPDRSAALLAALRIAQEKGHEHHDRPRRKDSTFEKNKRLRHHRKQEEKRKKNMTEARQVHLPASTPNTSG